MKKFISILFLVVLSFTLVSCGKGPLENPDKDYYLSLNDSELNDANKMSAIHYSDKIVRKFKKTFKSASYLYVIEVELSSGDKLSVAKCAKNTTTPDYNAQDKISGPVENLTSDFLKVPQYTEFDDGNGSWNDKIEVLSGGSYYFIFAETPSTGQKYIALIKK